MKTKKLEKGTIQRKNVLHDDAAMSFQCRPGLPCFTKCCSDVNIFLTPYDILRMKNCLKISSAEFLARHTRTLIPQSTGLPVIQLKMNQGQDRRCPFVQDDGCRIYVDRPWACRMYPLDREEDGSGYTLMVAPEVCHGQIEQRTWTVKEWLCDQGLDPYEEMGERFNTMMQNARFAKEGITNPRLQDMYRMACYDLDTFRRFVFETRFLSIFDLEADVIDLIRTDDEALLLLALRWVQFGFSAGDVLPIKEEVIKARMAEMEGKKSQPD